MGTIFITKIIGNRLLLLCLQFMKHPVAMHDTEAPGTTVSFGPISFIFYSRSPLSVVRVLKR